MSFLASFALGTVFFKKTSDIDILGNISHGVRVFVYLS